MFDYQQRENTEEYRRGYEDIFRHKVGWKDRLDKEGEIIMPCPKGTKRKPKKGGKK